MESHKHIETLLEKYFQGETSIAEESELKNYFSSANVAQHLEQYKPMFAFFTFAKSETANIEVPMKSKKTNNAAWLSIAASVVVLLGVGLMFFNSNSQEDLGTYDNPEIALKETQKALSLLSGNVNKGIESMQYVQEYENVKSSVFPQY